MPEKVGEVKCGDKRSGTEETETESPCPESTEDLVCGQLDHLCHCYSGFCDDHLSTQITESIVHKRSEKSKQRSSPHVFLHNTKLQN